MLCVDPNVKIVIGENSQIQDHSKFRREDKNKPVGGDLRFHSYLDASTGASFAALLAG